MDALIKQLEALIAQIKIYLETQKPPSPMPPNAYLWDTPENSRHSVRVICDEMGLTLHEKNIITACIQVESGFKNSAIGRNMKNGVLLSTDWGLVQINDYYNIGVGKYWSSVKQVLDNPDKAVRWMITMFKQGKLNLWVSYSSGAYLKYMPTLGSEDIEITSSDSFMNNSSKPFTLNSSDVFRSFALAVVVAVLGGLQQMLQAHGFDFAHWDYAMILNLGISAFVAQLGINFVSNPDRTINIPAVGAVGPKVPNA